MAEHSPQGIAETELDALLLENRFKPVTKDEESRLIELLLQMGFDLRTADAVILGIKNKRGTGKLGLARTFGELA